MAPSSVYVTAIAWENISGSKFQISDMQHNNVIVKHFEYGFFTFIKPNVMNHEPNMLYEFKFGCTEVTFSIDKIADSTSKYGAYECRT